MVEVVQDSGGGPALRQELRLLDDGEGGPFLFCRG